LWSSPHVCGVLHKSKTTEQTTLSPPQHRDCAGQSSSIRMRRASSCRAEMVVRSQTRAERARCRRAVLAVAKAARAACSCVLAACTRTRWRTGSARETKEQPRASLRSLSRALCAWRAIMTVAQALAVACPREGRGTAEPMRLANRVRRLRGYAHPAPGKLSANPGPDIRRGSPAHT
jgi:hypothetical protein